jgi:HK97 family phage portal protein
VLGRLVRGALHDPAVPLTATSLLDWLGGGRSDAGVAVTEKRVYGLPSYYRAIATKAGTLASLPHKPYNAKTRRPVVQRTVLDKPNPRQTAFEFWFTTYANAISWGNGYGLKVRDRSWIVREVWPIHPSRCTPRDVSTTEDNPQGKVFDITWPDGTMSTLGPDDVFHLPYLSLDGISGIRPLELFRTTLGIAIAGDTAAAKFYANGSRIDGVLVTDKALDQTKADALKARWKAKMSGPVNASEVAVLDNGTKFERIALPPGDAQLLESRKFSRSEIGTMVGVPPHLVGDVERSTSWGTGIEQQVLNWVKFDLGGWIELAEQRSTWELLPTDAWYAEISVQALLRGDMKARAEFYRVLTSIGVLKPTHVQELENIEPDPLVDFYTIPKNMQILRTAAEAAAAADAAAGGTQ